jgi:hypothetical protein
MVSSVDSNYAMDKESRGSASGNLHAVGGMTANWSCNTQSKHQSMSKGLQEVLFSQMLVKELGGCFFTVIVLEDNTGATFLVKNQQVGARTKHVDVRHHFIGEHCEKKDFDVKHVKSEENESDILTKNMTEKILKGHAENIRNGTVMAWMDCQKSVEMVATGAWRKNVELEESDNSWTEIC